MCGTRCFEEICSLAKRSCVTNDAWILQEIFYGALRTSQTIQETWHILLLFIFIGSRSDFARDSPI